LNCHFFPIVYSGIRDWTCQIVPSPPRFTLPPQIPENVMSDHDYRAYRIGRTGHILERFDLTAADEATARQQAKRLVDGHAVELWLEARRIATFHPEE
jgi:hypothetical protein